MTSKTLWNDFLRNECRSRIWMYVGWALILFFSMPVMLLMMIDTLRQNMYMAREEYLSSVTGFLGTGYGLYGMISIILGILTAFLCFGFVYRKSALDLYHSLSLKREKLFLIRHLAGSLIPLILYVFTSLFSAIVLLIRGCLVKETAVALIFATLVNMVAFLMAYHVAIIAIMLTGTLIVGLLGSVVLMYATVFASWMFRFYKSYCFQTYYYGEPEAEGIVHMLLNPAAIMLLEPDMDHAKLRLCLIFLETILFALIGMLLYRMRPSECTGKSLCYSVSKHIIRIPLVILASLSGGLFVSFLFMSLPEPWYWAAFLISGLAAHLVLELIFEQEVKGMLRHPAQLAACLVVAGLISCAYQYDFFGYDRYMPAEDQVASVSVRMNSIENEISHFIEADNGKWEYSDYDEILTQELFTDPAAVLNMAGGGIASLNPERSAIQRRMNDMYGESDVKEKEKLGYVICYHLKSGKNVYRTYNADPELILQDVATVYENPAYKEFLYQVTKMLDADKVDLLEARDWEDKLIFDGNSVNIREFLTAYAKDLEARKLSDLKAYPILKLSSTDKEDFMDVLCGYSVYESDVNTMACLQSAGIDPASLKAQLAPEMIDSIRVHDYSLQRPEYGDMAYTDMAYSDTMTYGEFDDGSAAFYTRDENPEDIKRLSMIMIPSNMSYSNSVLHPSSSWIDLEVTYRDSAQNERTSYFVLPYGETY